MDSLTLQSRTSNSFFPPHRTQLHPRMHLNSFSPPNLPSQNSNKSQSHKYLIFFVFFLTVPFIFYLFYTAQRIHHSTKFSEPKSQLFAVFIDSGSSDSCVRVYEILAEGIVPLTDGQMPLIAGHMKIRRGLAGFSKDPGNAGGLVDELVEFAKGRVPKKEWGNTKVQLMATGEEVNELEMKVKEMIMESCRRVLRRSGFTFKDEWAHVTADEEKGAYAWMAVNYALGTLGGDPQETTGVVELGGNSLKVTSTSRALAKSHSPRSIRFSGVTYNLLNQKLTGLGQDAVWESLLDLHTRAFKAVPRFRENSAVNPCIPKGYGQSSVGDSKLFRSRSSGNFSACKHDAMTLLKSRQEECVNPPCKIIPSFLLELQGKAASQQMFFTSEFFGLLPMSTLYELEAAGQQYCGSDWDKLKRKHQGIDDLDLLRYCFSSAYMVALLHDGLGIPMNVRRIGFAKDGETSRLDWTLGAFILQTMVESRDTEVDSLDDIVGNESVTYFSLFAFVLIALLAVIFVLQSRKPQLKTIYDLQKGHYIVTRVPR